ncbi:MAG: GMC family oxidoreductase, partial [Myxococcota bacterium]
MTRATSYEYVIVGGGSAGCVVAGRLAKAGREVLLLEAGDDPSDHPETFRADGYKDAFLNDRLMWERFTTPQPGCAHRPLWIGTGTGLGGSGSVNGMVYTRGGRADYADWPRGWQWDDLVPSFEALEKVLRPNRRGPTPFTEAFIDAAERAGFRRSHDLNDGDLAGVLGYEWMSYEGDQRRSSYVSFLFGADLPTLTVETGARVTRILTQGGAAIAVEYRIGNDLHCAAATEEVVLAAGALETPKLLMLSGIGPADELQAQGVDVVLDAPEVGKNLHDHPNVSMFHLGRRSVGTYYPQVYGFHRANPESTHIKDGAPDTCYVLYPAPSSFREAAKRMAPTLALPPGLHGKSWARNGFRGLLSLGLDNPLAGPAIDRLWGIVVILGKPKSRGLLRLRS